jgi:HK97 family phage portal protein
MPRVVQTVEGLERLQPSWQRGGLASVSSMALFADYTADYASIYRTQPNVRTTVDFIARNVAQLGLHLYRRVSDNDRERLADHPLAELIRRPNDRTTRYRMISSTLVDLGVYFNAYWLKVRTRAGIQLLRVPPWAVHVRGRLLPTGYVVHFGARTLLTAEALGDGLELDPSEVVHFRGDNVDSETVGLSPLETLRRVLAEEAASGDYREGLWKHGARVSGLIKRPAEAPEMSTAAQERFLAQWEMMTAGSTNSGKTAILDEGMSFEKMSFTAEEAQYLESRKLTREEVARAYHVPLPMVGILDHATFSNIKEQHKQLYQDCLGPWLVMLEEDLELQLLPEFGDPNALYLEFNIAEKMKGSFEEQASAISTTVGRPILTANEGRALLNRNALDGDADQLVTPLNVMVGGQASPRDSAPKALGSGTKADDDVDATHIRTRDRHVEKWAQVLEAFFGRQDRVISSKLGGKADATVDDVFDGERWDRELTGELTALNVATATVFAQKVADELDLEDLDTGPQLTAWLTENARIAAEGINATTRDQLVAALDEDDWRTAVAGLFEIARKSRAPQIAQTKVTTAANFGAGTAAEQGGAKTKTWRVNSGNPRSQHRALSGSTVAIGKLFSNGMKWPGDYRGGADNNAHCQCSVTFGR